MGARVYSLVPNGGVYPETPHQLAEFSVASDAYDYLDSVRKRFGTDSFLLLSTEDGEVRKVVRGEHR